MHGILKLDAHSTHSLVARKFPQMLVEYNIRKVIFLITVFQHSARDRNAIHLNSFVCLLLFLILLKLRADPSPV